MDAKVKRQRVMARSIKLGHCVCDPRKPCPCPLFKEKNICTCAGEREPLDVDRSQVRLTQYVRSGGCASKIGQKDLHAVLSQLPVVEDPRLLVGMATADDAGVFRLSPDTTIVQTVDVFTPVVDDPYTFGRIAACNSLSDVYAMGGTPVTALSIIGFPIYTLPHEVMADILRGGMDVLKEAGTILLGGHSINDEEVKFGFAVTGLIHPDKVITNAGARPGDALILTKPLGTGILSLANQIGKAPAEALRAAEESMATLNRTAAEVMVRHGAHACTDVTGFGFLGHLTRMVVESGVTAEVWADSLPLLPSVRECAAQGMFSGANERNAEYSADRTDFADGVNEEAKAVLFDAQTSGGLLVAVPGDQAEAMLRELHERGVVAAVMVGRVTSASKGRVEIRRNDESGAASVPAPKQNVTQEASMSQKVDATESACCGGHEGPGATDALGKFQEFLGAASKPGALDVVTKELIAIALGLAVNCVPCSRIHIKKAVGMGIGKEELEEAAALAVAFGGCRALMLWNELKKELL